MILVNNRTRGIATRASEADEFTVYVSDIFNNKPPAGSEIEVSASGECTIESETSITVPVSAAPGAFGFALRTGGDGGDGSVNITLNPAGDSGSFTRTFACSSSPPPDPCDFSPRPPECEAP